jgi:hypothetical protein
LTKEKELKRLEKNKKTEVRSDLIHAIGRCAQHRDTAEMRIHTSMYCLDQYMLGSLLV